MKESPRRSDLVFMIPMAMGMLLFFTGTEVPVRTAPNPQLGNWIALGSGGLWAGVIVGFRWLSRDGDARSATATVGLGNVLTCLLCLLFAWHFPVLPAIDWAILVYLGVFQITLAYIFVTQAMRQISALKASLILLVEPVLNPIWTWLVYKERPSLLAMSGGALILTATAAMALRGSRSAPE